MKQSTKQNTIYFWKKFLFYFIIGSCVCGPAMYFVFPFVIVAAAVCATIDTMNKSDKIFTKHFWIAVSILVVAWIYFFIFHI